MAIVKLGGKRQLDYAHEVLNSVELGKNYEMRIQKCKKTPPQLRTAHLWCAEIAQASECYTMEQIKLRMKQAYGVLRTVEVFGEVQLELKSWADYDVEEMRILMEGIQEFAANYGITLTNPDDAGRE